MTLRPRGCGVRRRRAHQFVSAIRRPAHAAGVTLTVPPVVGVLCRHRGFEQCGTTAGTEDRSGAANSTFVLPNTITKLRQCLGNCVSN